MLFLCMVLIWFEAVSDLKVNLGKSELVAVGAVHNFELLVARVSSIEIFGSSFGGKIQGQDNLESNS